MSTFSFLLSFFWGGGEGGFHDRRLFRQKKKIPLLFLRKGGSYFESLEFQGRFRKKTCLLSPSSQFFFFSLCVNMKDDEERRRRERVEDLFFGGGGHSPKKKLKNLAPSPERKKNPTDIKFKFATSFDCLVLKIRAVRYLWLRRVWVWPRHDGRLRAGGLGLGGAGAAELALLAGATLQLGRWTEKEVGKSDALVRKNIRMLGKCDVVINWNYLRNRMP